MKKIITCLKCGKSLEDCTCKKFDELKVEKPIKGIEKTIKTPSLDQ